MYVKEADTKLWTRAKVKMLLGLTKKHARKKQWSNGSEPSCILNLGISVMSGQLQAPTALTRGKNLRYPLNRQMGWSQSRSQRHSPIGIKTLFADRQPGA